MKQDALLRLLLAAFLMYIALPSFSANLNTQAHLFWISWFLFFMLVVGANLAILFQLNPQSVVNVEEDRERQTMKN